MAKPASPWPKLNRAGRRDFRDVPTSVDNLVLEFARVLLDVGPLLRIHRVHHPQHFADHRAAVRVRGTQEQLVARQMILFLYPLGDVMADRRRKTQQITRHQDGSLAGVVLQRQGFGIKFLDNTLRRASCGWRSPPSKGISAA